MVSGSGEHGQRKRSRKEGRTSERRHKRPAPSVPALEAEVSPKEENRAVLKRLLSSFDALTGCDKEGAAEDAYQHVLTESAGEQPLLNYFST